MDAILGAFFRPSEGGPVSATLGEINHAFAADTVEAVLQNLDQMAASTNAHSAWADGDRRDDPHSVPDQPEDCARAGRRGRDMTFEECMRTEFRIVSRIVYGKDFYEGRARRPC